MASAARLFDLLPSLWRPEIDAPADDLLAALLRAAGARFDAAAVEAGDVMQAHWVGTADSALVSPFVARSRALAGEPPLMPGDAGVEAHRHLDDLPRLAALIDLAPWREPLDERETVEEFRRRIYRIVALHRDGVGTRLALWRMTRASLPVADRGAGAGLRERGFTVEEMAPAAPVVLAAASRGAPDGLVGPLMRWRVASGAVLATAPELYVTGLAAEGQVAATEAPIVERFDPARGTGVGIGYDGTVPPGETLAILPTATAWLGGDAGLLAAHAGPGGDPTATGPWAAAEGAPEGGVAALAAAGDGALWAAVNDGEGGALWRLGAAGWQEAAAGLPAVHALAPDDDALLIGHERGLAALRLFDAAAAPEPDPAAAEGAAVHALAGDPAGGWWAATATGAARRAADGALLPVGPGARGETETRLDAVLAERDGFVYFGGPGGLFLHDAARGTWHVYRGGSAGETIPDWAPWDPGGPLPDPDEGFLPPVTALRRGSDGTLWIGTGQGIAGYRARPRRGTYATLLSAFPELGLAPVHAIEEDARQRVWFATGRGLVVWDGTDWHQMVDGGLVRLPRPGDDPLAFTHWRFDRRVGEWQSQERGAATGFRRRAPEPVTAAAPPVRSIAWTDGAVARLGRLEDSGFADAGPAPGALSLRIKPEPTRIVTGGLPAVPRLPRGASDWRYLAREEDDPPAPSALPAWTREGRLLPPPDAAAAPLEGRFLTADEAALLDQVFAFPPAARVTMRWRPRAALSVIVRLERRGTDDALAPAVLNRLRAGLDQVRPAGARVRIALGEDIVTGGPDG